MKLFTTPLTNTNGSHNKFYRICIEQAAPDGSGVTKYLVNCEYGAIGKKARHTTKTKKPIKDLNDAKRTYHNTINGKVKEGYTAHAEIDHRSAPSPAPVKITPPLSMKLEGHCGIAAGW